MATTIDRTTSSKAEDLYKGHKVVVMPSSAFGGKMLHEWVSSMNRSEDPMPRRSLSAGRAATRGRDIVKETYDRMAISSPSRQHPWDDALISVQSSTTTSITPSQKSSSSDNQRGREGISCFHPGSRDTSFDCSESSQQQRDRKEAFQKRYVTAAAMSRGRNDTRDGDRKAFEEEPRSRSLSRGRYRDFKWPPAKQGDKDASSENVQVKESPVEAPTHASTMDCGLESAKSVPSLQIKKDIRPDDLQPLSPTSWTRRARTSQSAAAPNMEDEKKESEDGPQDTTKKEFTPIKDRISVFAARRHRNQRQAPNTKAIHPPLINIYDEVKKYEESLLAASSQASGSLCEDPDVCESTAEPLTPLSTAAAAAANAAADLLRTTNSEVETPNRRLIGQGRSARSGVATAFLAAIQAPRLSPLQRPTSSNASAPLLEIPSNEGSPGGVDANSVAMSSVSCDDLSVSGKGSNSKWLDRNKAASTNKKLVKGTQPNFAQQSVNVPQEGNGKQQLSNNKKGQQHLTSEEIERIVDERVQARIAEVEIRSERLIRQFESQMEEKHKARVEALESKVDQLTNVIAKFWSELQGRQ